MYDIAIIGAGPGGYELALLLSKGSNDNKNAKDGLKVALIEKDKLGGVCLNEGCIPTKNYLQSALYKIGIQKANKLGVNINETSFCLKTLKENTNNLINLSIQGIEAKCKQQGIDIFSSTGSLLDKNTIQLSQGKQIKATNIVLATGSVPRDMPTLKIDNDRILTSRDIFHLNEIPKSILVIGGGVIGVEFASFFSTFGCKVDIIARRNNIISSEDNDVSKTLEREMSKNSNKNIEVFTNSSVRLISKTKNDISFEITKTIGSNTKTYKKTYEKALISIGRVPNTKELGLENVDIDVDDGGFIKVNDNLQTTSKNIFAIGDLINTPSLAHMAEYEAKSVASFILEGIPLTQKTPCPNVVFSYPQVSSVGAKEVELKQNNINFGFKKIFFKTNAKSKIKDNDSGFVKILYNKDNNIILGASIVGIEACEMIHVFLIAINKQTKINEIKDYIFAHPTLSECINKFV